MIISHKHRFIFLKSKKTAGTSIEVFLSQHCSDQDILTPIRPPVPGHVSRNAQGFHSHMGAVDIRKRLPLEVWKNYFKFTVERNPWEKVISRFWMLRSETPSVSFDDYLKMNRWPLNYPIYSAMNGGVPTVLVDRIVRYEQLNAGLADVFSHLGIPFSGRLEVFAKAEYRLDHRPYREVYTEQQAEIVRRVFELEIRMHGYEF